MVPLRFPGGKKHDLASWNARLGMDESHISPIMFDRIFVPRGVRR
jgi:hypothetical protein